MRGAAAAVSRLQLGPHAHPCAQGTILPQACHARSTRSGIQGQSKKPVAIRAVWQRRQQRWTGSGWTSRQLAEGFAALTRETGSNKQVRDN